MARGGYQEPQGARPPSGPGKFSERTDTQATRAPDLDTPGQQYGDRQMLEAAQDVAPVPRAAKPASRPQGSSSSSANPGAGAGLPPHLFEEPSRREGEPTTAGMDAGMGEGRGILQNPPPPKDDRELVLEYLVRNYSNKDAADMLAEIRGGQQATSPIQSPNGGIGQALRPDAAEESVQPEPLESGLEDAGLDVDSDTSGFPAPDSHSDPETDLDVPLEEQPEELPEDDSDLEAEEAAAQAPVEEPVSG